MRNIVTQATTMLKFFLVLISVILAIFTGIYAIYYAIINALLFILIFMIGIGGLVLGLFSLKVIADRLK